MANPVDGACTSSPLESWFGRTRACAPCRDAWMGLRVLVFPLMVNGLHAPHTTQWPSPYLRTNWHEARHWAGVVLSRAL